MLASHHHIPLGTTSDEFEKIYHEKLRPFLSALYKYPHIPVTLHYSGIVLNWLERAHFEFFMLLKDMIARDQVELLGGGFYEPMLPLLPPADKLGQVELLTTYLRKQFGRRPQGCRLPALAWEQSLVGTLNNCGMFYTFLEGAHFLRAGLSDAFPCITEDQGKILTVFPVSNAVSDLFAHQRAGLVLDSLLAQNARRAHREVITVFLDHIFMGNSVADDRTKSMDTEESERTIEKSEWFGAWESNDVYDETNVQRDLLITGYDFFFQDISRRCDKIDFILPSKLYCGTRGALKKAYFPPSLNLPLSCGATTPRSFLINYPEANYLYSKMMFTNAVINQLHGDRSRKRTAREEIWKAQGYDAFCPSEGGGIFRHSVRKAAYRALLEAEKISREKDPFTPSLMVFDFDMDGSDEYLFQEEQINCYVKPLGAGVFELDYLPKTWNYLDTFALSTGETCCKRSAWTDILAPQGVFETTTLADRVGEIRMQAVQAGFLEGEPEENAFRFCKNELFEVVVADKHRGKASFRLPPNPNIPYGNIEIYKTYRVDKSALFVSYTLVNRGQSRENFTFIPSVDLSFPGEGDAFLRIYKLDADVKESVPIGEVTTGVRALKFQDIKNEAIIIIDSDKLFDACILTVRTPCSLSGETVEIYQSTNIMPLIHVSLESEERFETAFSMRMYH